MKVSIVTPTFNSATTVVRTVESINRQTHNDVEHIVVDGQSKDETLMLIRNHSRVKGRIVSESDRGIYDAMNKGIRLAQG